MFTFFFIIVTIIFNLSRWYISLTKEKSSGGFILVSLFIQMIPFNYGKSLYTFLNGIKVDEDVAMVLGEFGNSLRIERTLVMILLLVVLGFNRYKSKNVKRVNNKIFYLMLVFCALSVFNPKNIFPLSVLPFIFSIVQLYVLLKIIESNFSKADIFRGIYDGLLIVTIIQFTLSICYPILGFEFVTTLFRGESALEWAQRRGSRSAIGTFGHPGVLALFSLLTSVFYLSCYLNKYKNKTSSYLLIINLLIISLTFSRTTYLASIAVLVFIFIVYNRKNTNIFSFKNILSFLLLSSAFLFILYLTPLSDIFLKSDANDQVENRMMHWLFGYEIWQNSKWIGVGINAHVYYMVTKFNVNMNNTILAFLVRSPIHNIHMIILAETGILGIIAWLYFFVSRILKYSKRIQSEYKIISILNLTYMGCLIAIFIYGFFGWSPFRSEILYLLILFGFFSSDFSIKINKPNYNI